MSNYSVLINPSSVLVVNTKKDGTAESVVMHTKEVSVVSGRTYGYWSYNMHGVLSSGFPSFRDRHTRSFESGPIIDTKLAGRLIYLFKL